MGNPPFPCSSITAALPRGAASCYWCVTPPDLFPGVRWVHYEVAARALSVAKAGMQQLGCAGLTVSSAELLDFILQAHTS